MKLEKMEFQLAKNILYIQEILKNQMKIPNMKKLW